MTYTHQHNKVGNILPSELHCEIEKSTISKQLDWITIKDLGGSYDVCCTFDEEPSAAEKTLLEGLIDSHPAVVYTDEEYLIYDSILDENLVNNKKVPPVDLDYNVLGLKKERIFNSNGFLNTVNYWKNFDRPTKVYSELVVKEEITYHRANDMLEYRQKSISWYKRDGSFTTDKTTEKEYNSEEGFAADKRARTQIIERAKMESMWLVMQTEQCTLAVARWHGESLVNDLILEIDKYIQGSKQPLIDAITNFDTQGGTVNGWLDNDTWIPDGQGGTLTIRGYLVYSINV